ncbi:MAG: hypothetical protein KME45_27380 [Stenomitos rutilans HA7619-LM2]|jgi:C4-dicarboxylate-specific signal transduction histidine kinase|nr:hypothetical protein [Stenomitos rutilans HA7619-LM2]
MNLDASFITAVGGLASGAFAAYWTAKTFYLKRQDELRERQRQELAAAQAEIDRQKAQRQAELDTYAEGKTKEYAAQRDFNHLMRQYEALSMNLNTLHELGDRRLDGIEDDLRDVKGLLQMLAVAVGQTETGIQRYLKRED